MDYFFSASWLPEPFPDGYDRSVLTSIATQDKVRTPPDPGEPSKVKRRRIVALPDSLGRLFISALLLFAWDSQGVSAAEQASPSGRSRVVLPPENEADALALLAQMGDEQVRVRTELEARIKPGDSDPSETDKQFSDVLSELAESLSAYQTLLKEHVGVLAHLRSVGEGAALARQSEELWALQQRIQELRAEQAAPHLEVSESELDQSEKEWQQANDVAVKAALARAERLKRLTELAEQKAAESLRVEESQAALTAEAERFELAAAAAPTEAQTGLAAHRFRAAQIHTGLSLLRNAYVSARMDLDIRLTEDAEQLLPPLRELAELLDAKCERLRRIRARNERQQLLDWVEYAATYPDRVSTFEQTFWPLRLALNDAQLEIRRLGEEAGIADRFPEDRFADLSSDLAMEQAIWNQFVGSLSRRPQEQVLQRYREIVQRIRKWQGERDHLRALYDATFDDQSRIELRLSELDEEIRVRLRETRPAIEAVTRDMQTAQYRKELAAQKRKCDDDSAELAAELKLLIERLDASQRAVAAHVDSLSAIRTRLQWSSISICSVPPWKYRWSRSQEEWNDSSRRQRRALDTAALQKGWGRISTAGWIALAAGLGIAAAAAAWVRRRAQGSYHRLEERLREKLRVADASPLPLSDRIHLHGLRLVRAAAPVLLPALAVVFWLRLGPASGPLPFGVPAFLCAVALSFGLVRFSFGGDDPRVRVLPCSNVVARTCTRWLNGFLLVSAWMIPVPFFLSIMQWAFYTRAHLWALYKIVILAMLVVFLTRRRTLLAIAGNDAATRQSFAFAVISSLYPFLHLFVIGLLAAQLAGYSELTTYLIVGSAATLGTVVLATLLLRYVTDLFRRFQGILQRAVFAAEAGRMIEEGKRRLALSSGREVAPTDRDPVTADATLQLGVLLTLFRLGVWGGACVLVLRCWGFSWTDLHGWMQFQVTAAAPDRPAVTIGRALLAALAVVGAWAISRSLRTILDTRVYPTYAQLDRGGRVAVNTVLHYMLLLIGLYFAMFLLRIPLGAVTVVLGTLGLGLGLASQPLFMNFLSGLIMLFERHIRVGDIVDIEGNLGEVTNISIRATTIKTFDNVDMVIPNSEFVGNKVVNWTLKDERIRGKIPVGVAYGADPRDVERLLLEVANQSPLVLRDPPPRVRFMNFGENSLDFNLYAWFRNVTDRWDFLTDARFKIFDVFQEHGIEIPFPQRTLSLKEDHPIRVEVVADGERRQASAAAAERLFLGATKVAETGKDKK